MKKLKIGILTLALAAFAGIVRADTTTTRLGLTKPSIGSTGWGVKWNTNADTMDAGFAVLSATNAFTQPQYFSDGSVSAPSRTFSSDTDTGLYRSASGIMRYTSNGLNTVSFITNGLEISSGTVQAPNNNATQPSYTYSADPDTGFWSTGTQGDTAFSANGSTTALIGRGLFTGVHYSTSVTILQVNYAGAIDATNTTVNSTTRTYTSNGSSKVFTISTADGDGALVYCNYLSATVTVLGSGGRIAATTTPTSSQIGINKSANSHTINFVTGSAASGTFASWGICFLGSAP